MTDVLEDTRLEQRLELGAPWALIVWDDPVNLMTYVSWVFRSYFGFEREKAERLMLQVHTEGRAQVASGTREEIERHVEAMHGYGLWATLEKVEL
ncbi:ATP-dependent Clp protease adapter ClpS [uncultured Amnibacterium sp.]|uniref:ATP-dependent Clp protease adapter ClpS n=1 Tax=uncultured Amnibacterium sp. TaxID=1631851 RepID=UPI0035CB4E2E